MLVWWGGFKEQNLRLLMLGYSPNLLCLRHLQCQLAANAFVDSFRSRFLSPSGILRMRDKTMNKLPGAFRNILELEWNPKTTNKLPDTLPVAFWKLPTCKHSDCSLMAGIINIPHTHNNKGYRFLIFDYGGLERPAYVYEYICICV